MTCLPLILLIKYTPLLPAFIFLYLPLFRLGQIYILPGRGQNGYGLTDGAVVWCAVCYPL